MDLHSVQLEDIVEIDRRGFHFLAHVKKIENGVLGVRPIDNRLTYYHAPARQVVGIWHANRKTRRRLTVDPAEVPIGVADA